MESAASLFFPNEDDAESRGLLGHLELFRLEQLMSVGRLIQDPQLGISIDNIMDQMLEDQRSAATSLLIEEDDGNVGRDGLEFLYALVELRRFDLHVEPCKRGERGAKTVGLVVVVRDD